MVLRHPEIVVSEIVHQSTDRLGLVEDGYEFVVGVESVVRGGSGEADVIQVNVSCKEASEFVNHSHISHSGIGDIVVECTLVSRNPIESGSENT